MSRLATKGYYDTFYGAAKKYKKVWGGYGTVNCYSYALGFKKVSQPGLKSGERIPMMNTAPSVEDVSRAIIEDVYADGRWARIISGPNAPILEDEYRIAVRVGTEPYGEDDDGNALYDYHLMVQHSDGRWSEKNGQGGDSIVHKQGETPDTLSWDLMDIEGYYDSDIIYLAVTFNKRED